MLPVIDSFGPEEFAVAAGVSRETLDRLKTYASMLEEWNTQHNLVSKASLQGPWRRHFWDLAQILPFIPPDCRSLIDLGSGAGFPALVLAEFLRDRVDFKIVLVEATAKKCRFLEAVSNRLGLNPQIRNDRIENLARESFDVITARALKPLAQLFPYAQRFWSKKTIGLFLKGQNVDAELTESRKSWRMTAQRHPSRSDLSGTILEVRELQNVEPKRRKTSGT